MIFQVIAIWDYRINAQIEKAIETYWPSNKFCLKFLSYWHGLYIPISVYSIKPVLNFSFVNIFLCQYVHIIITQSVQSCNLTIIRLSIVNKLVSF